MAHCDEYIELISAAIDGALSPAETEKLNAHLTQCPECEALYKELTALHTALGDLPPVEVPADLTERIMAAVAAEQVLPFAPAEKKHSSRHWQKWLASAAVLAVVLMGTWTWKPWANHVKDQPLPPAQETQKAPAPSEAVMPESGSEVSVAATLNDIPEGAGAASEKPSSLPVASGSGDTRAKTTENRPTTASISEDTKSPGEASEEIPAPANAIAPQMASMDQMAADPLPNEALEPEQNGNDQETSAQMPVLFSVSPTVSNELPTSPLPEETHPPMLRSFQSPLPSETPVEEAVQPLTPEEALELVIDHIFAYSAPEDLSWEISEEETEETFSCCVSWSEGDDRRSMTLRYNGENEQEPNAYCFACAQEGSSPVLYMVQKADGSISAMCLD